MVTDVTKRGDLERLRDRALQAFGHVDVWINNAGKGIAKNVLALTDDDVDEMMLLNLKSALYGMQIITPHFQQRNAGHLINVSSFLSRVPLATVRSAYSASKAALNSLTANLRMDLRTTHPRVWAGGDVAREKTVTKPSIPIPFSETQIAISGLPIAFRKFCAVNSEST